MSTTLEPELETETAEPVEAEVDTAETEFPDEEDEQEIEEEDREPADDAEPSADESAEGEAAPTDATPDASVPPEPEEAPEPVTIEWEGGSYTIPGATFDHKNNALKFADVRGARRFHTLLKHGVTFEATRAKYERQEQRHQSELESAKAEAQQFMDALTEVMGLPIGPDGSGPFAERILAFREQFPQIKQDMERERYERRIAELEGRNKGPAEFQAPPVEHVQEWAESVAIRNLTEDAKHFPWMTEDCVAELRDVMTSPETIARYVRTADAEAVQMARANGQTLQLGEPYVHWPSYYAISKPIAKAWEVAHTKVAATKADAAKQVQTLGKTAQQNSKILAQAKPAAKASAPAAAPANAPKTRAQLDAEMAAARSELAKSMNPRRNTLGQFI